MFFSSQLKCQWGGCWGSRMTLGTTWVPARSYKAPEKLPSQQERCLPMCQPLIFWRNINFREGIMTNSWCFNLYQDYCPKKKQIEAIWAIFEAGNTFSKAYHVWYLFVKFSGCNMSLKGKWLPKKKSSNVFRSLWDEQLWFCDQPYLKLEQKSPTQWIGVNSRYMAAVRKFESFSYLQSTQLLKCFGCFWFSHLKFFEHLFLL